MISPPASRPRRPSLSILHISLPISCLVDSLSWLTSGSASAYSIQRPRLLRFVLLLLRFLFLFLLLPPDHRLHTCLSPSLSPSDWVPTYLYPRVTNYNELMTIYFVLIQPGCTGQRRDMLRCQMQMQMSVQIQTLLTDIVVRSAPPPRHPPSTALGTRYAPSSACDVV